MVGDKSAVTSNGNRELIVATRWFAGHEIQLKNPTVKKGQGKYFQMKLPLCFRHITLLIQSLEIFYRIKYSSTVHTTQGLKQNQILSLNFFPQVGVWFRGWTHSQGYLAKK